MKKARKLTAGIIALLMLVLMMAACGPSPSSDSQTSSDSQSTSSQSTDDTSDGDATEGTTSEKTLRIYAWNDEFQGLFQTYFEEAGLVPAGVEVEWVITPNKDNAYQDKLDADLAKQDSNSDKIDIFLIEADYASKYVDTGYTLDVINDVGLTNSDVANMYDYTKKIAQDSAGNLKAVSWQATPGLFAYRRSIAMDVLGTDDPDEVQKALSTWDKFDDVAAQAAAKNYKMLSGYDDSYRTFSNNVSAPWVDADKMVVVDDNVMRWVEQTKEYTDKGYNNKTALWAPEWASDQGPEGNVFGFFYSTWGINFTLKGNSKADAEGPDEVGNGIFGDYAVCYGPESYYWGGTWICAAAGTDNIDLVREVMHNFTCNQETMKQITLDTLDYTNNSVAMEEIANDSSYGSDFLGGQNHIALFAEAAKEIDMSNISPYDQGCNEEFQGAFKDYFDGNVSKEDALANFHTAIVEKYPALSIPEDVEE